MTDNIGGNTEEIHDFSTSRIRVDPAIQADNYRVLEDYSCILTRNDVNYSSVSKIGVVKM